MSAKTWRPDNWDNPHKMHEVTWGDMANAPQEYLREPGLHKAYEAGADAMLEALLKSSDGQRFGEVRKKW